MKETVGNVQYASLLYDFYGGLLREKQLEIMDLYHEDNLSLSEIAEELGMSRQAVHYTLKKAETTLEKYESVLGLIEKYQANSARAEKAESIIQSIIDVHGEDEKLVKSLEKVQNIVEEITE